jgi:RNA polymerase sigma-70 factor (ECF subfamily)
MILNHELADADLVAKALAGDREAFGCLYDRYARLVRAVVYKVGHDVLIVQDLTQETFLRGYRNLDHLRQPDRFGAWIVGIARQVASEYRRSIRRDRHRFGVERAIEALSDPDVAGAVQTAEQIELVLRQVAELPERERLAVHAFFLQECDAGQAARLLELSRSGVYALLERALARLAARMSRGVKERE